MILTWLSLDSYELVIHINQTGMQWNSYKIPYLFIDMGYKNIDNMYLY